MTDFIANGESGASVRAKLNALYTAASGAVGRVDPILRAAVTEKLRLGAADVAIGYLGTSIGNAAAEHVRLMDPVWAAFAPNYMIRNALYDDATNLYGPGSLGNNAKITNNVAGSVLFEDTFDRANGALGTTGWAANTWTIASNKAVQASTSQVLVTSAAVGTDKYILEFDHTWGVDTLASMRTYFEFTDDTNSLFALLTNNGVVTLYLTPGNVVLAQSDTGDDIAAGEVLHFKITVDGKWVQVEVRGTTITAILTTAQRAALTGNKVKLTGQTGGDGTITSTWDNFKLSAIAPQRRMTIWNASVSGSTIAYHVAEIGTTMPTAVVGTLDAVIIEQGHNEGADSPATYTGNLTTLITAVRAAQTSVPIGLMMENPKVSPATNITAHAARVLAIPAYAASNSYGLIDGYGGFDVANLNPVDGIHPLPAGSAFIAIREAGAFGVA